MRAGLDVFADEPGPGRALGIAAGPAPPVVATHHIGASTEQAQRAVAAGVIEIVDAFVAGEARNCVNLGPSRLGAVTLTVRHLDRVGVLAQVLDLLSRTGLNVEHMENRVFRGGEAAVASIDIAGETSESLLADLGEIPDVLGVSQVELGEDRARGQWRNCEATGQSKGARCAQPHVVEVVDDDGVRPHSPTSV